MLMEESPEHQEIRVSWAVVQLQGWDLCSTPTLGHFLPKREDIIFTLCLFHSSLFIYYFIML
jgi:hypothetical protein